MRASIGAEPVRARLEVRLKDRFQHCLARGLHHPVEHGGDTQAAELPATLRDLHLPHRDGRYSPDFSRSRTWSRNTCTPTRVSMWATVTPSTPAVRAPALPVTRSHAWTRNAGS